MNYLAHALGYLDDDHHADALAPFHIVGTALPDWLRFVDRKARVRPEHLAAVAIDEHGGNNGAHHALRTGALRHHDDDAVFHADPAFDDVTRVHTAELRAIDPTLRASVLAHVLTEMLLDAHVIATHPHTITRYYDALDRVDVDVVAAFARRVTRRELALLPVLNDRFRTSRFLFDYVDDVGLYRCLVGVCTRVGMGTPPVAIVDTFGEARRRVAVAAAGLLPSFVSSSPKASATASS